MKKAIFIITYIFVLVFIAPISYAMTGTITGSHQAKVCHDVTCTTPTPGFLNFKPTGVDPLVVDSITGISGQIWGNELGWITMNPTGAGVRFTDSQSGLLTGKAWSQVSGWINFAPTGQQVRIDTTTGNFSGWAWTGGPFGGWIKFDCADASTCVNTSWRPEVLSPPSGGSGGGVLPIPKTEIDVCSNLEGIQKTLPIGYSVDANGSCIQTIDTCPNIPGDQTIVPTGYGVDGNDMCVLLSKKDVDYCPNIWGNQKSVPSGYEVDSSGSCFKKPKDVCPNLSGKQPIVPDNYLLQDNVCVFETIAKNEEAVTANTIQPAIVIAYPFIPDRIIIPSQRSILIKPFIFGDTLFHTNLVPVNQEFSIDLVSVGITIIYFVIVLIVFLRFILHRLKKR